mmetsp:Transcript_4529/g.4237  ORF Transcript_4529/g.4237 Transcript_4529/m.4237 type:complete len:238 (+) Transcript_4529:1024-1737(+)
MKKGRALNVTKLNTESNNDVDSQKHKKCHSNVFEHNQALFHQYQLRQRQNLQIQQNQSPQVTFHGSFAGSPGLASAKQPLGMKSSRTDFPGRQNSLILINQHLPGASPTFHKLTSTQFTQNTSLMDQPKTIYNDKNKKKSVSYAQALHENIIKPRDQHITTILNERQKKISYLGFKVPDFQHNWDFTTNHALQLHNQNKLESKQNISIEKRLNDISRQTNLASKNKERTLSVPESKY